MGYNQSYMSEIDLYLKWVEGTFPLPDQEIRVYKSTYFLVNRHFYVQERVGCLCGF